MSRLQLVGYMVTTAIVIVGVIGIPILFGWLIYKAIIGIIREVKKK